MNKSEAARLLGSLTSEKKAAAVRENGKQGGRPLKPLEDIECTCDFWRQRDPQMHASKCRLYRTWYQRQRRAKQRGETPS